MINKYTSVVRQVTVCIPLLLFRCPGSTAWHKMEGRKDISFGETPFSVVDSKVLDCQFGAKYFKQRPLIRVNVSGSKAPGR